MMGGWHLISSIGKAKLYPEYGLTKEQIDVIVAASALHDIGKIGIPDSVLNKPGKLSDEEYTIIKRHPLIGADILKNYSAIKDVTDGAKYHHERYDGKGYCSGSSPLRFGKKQIGI